MIDVLCLMFFLLSSLYFYIKMFKNCFKFIYADEEIKTFA